MKTLTGTPWVKKCPTCNALIFYKHRQSLCLSHNRNQCCRKCADNKKVGIVRPLEVREKISSSLLGFLNPFYGKHHSDETKEKLKMLCGHKVDELTKEKLSIKNSGKGNPFYGKHHDEIVKRTIGESTKRTHTGIKFTTQRRMRLSNALRGIRKSEEHKRKIGINSKIHIIKRKEELGILKIGFNPDACRYFDVLNEEKGWKLQHAMNGGERRILCYFVDAFDETQNIVIEYDEPHHFTWRGKLRTYDVVRMNDIISHLGCTFLRYNEKTGELKQYGKNYEIISD